MVSNRVLLEKIVVLTYRAGKMILADHDFEVGFKDSKANYVTSTDVKVQEMLRKSLSEILPEAAFFAEESGMDRPSACDSGYEWIVDPIDGTSNFARGLETSTVSVALAKDGKILMGAVRNPYTHDSFCAIRGQGAFNNGMRMKVSDRPKENAMVCLSWSAYDKSRARECFEISEELFGTCEDIRRTGSAAYELCLLAKGAVDMQFEIKLAPWDYAAGSIIVEEAGGFIGSPDGPLDMRNGGSCLAANNKENFDYLKSVITAHIRP